MEDDPLSRVRALWLSLLIAFAGTGALLALVVLLSWITDVADHRNAVREAAQQVAAHSDLIYADAVSVLERIEASDTVPCSPENIHEMFLLGLESLWAHNVAYGEGDDVLCSGFSGERLEDIVQPTDTIQPDGIELVINWPGGWLAELPDRGPILILRRGGYRVLVDQRQFYDALAWAARGLNVTIGTPEGITLLAAPAAGAKLPPPGENAVVAEARSAHWVVTVSADPVRVADRFADGTSTLIPAAAGIAWLFGAGSFWVLRHRRSVGSELSAAIRHHEFFLEYQPIVALPSRTCLGGEALVRWRRPNGEIVRPDLFIPIAEEIGLLSRITDEVIEMVVDDLGAILREDRSLYIAVNTGAADISSGRILLGLDRALAGSDIEPRQICIEATERSFVDIDGARTTLKELRRRGYRTAIDDFGTGYSSLQYLQELPIDTLKIDKAFIDAVGTEAVTSSVTDHIISLANDLDLTLVAEGVETEAQAAFLAREGVQSAQGWLFARAMPGEEFTDYYVKHRASQNVTASPERV